MKKHKAVRILDRTITKTGWQYVAGIGDTTYKVGLSQDHHNRLTGGSVKPEKLIEASLIYLLDREPPEQILAKFDLSQINLYFPAYESEIADYY